MEGLQAALPLFGPRHYLFPFLAHALGTLVGTFAATWAVGGRSWGPAAVVTALFLTGGTINAFLLPAPAWFIGADLLLAYLPMGWLGWQWGRRAGGTSAGTA